MKTPDLAWRGRIGTFNIGAGAGTGGVNSGVSSWYGCYLLQQGLNQLLSACLALVTLTCLLVIGNVELNPGPPSFSKARMGQPSSVNFLGRVIKIGIRRQPLLADHDLYQFKRSLSTIGLGVNGPAEEAAHALSTLWLSLFHQLTGRYWLDINLDKESTELQTPDGSKAWKELTKGLEFKDKATPHPDLHFLSKLHSISQSGTDLQQVEMSLEGFASEFGIRIELREIDDELFQVQVRDKVGRHDEIFLVKVRNSDQDQSVSYQAIISKVDQYEEQMEYATAMLEELEYYQLLKTFFDKILQDIFSGAEQSSARMSTFTSSVFELLKTSGSLFQILSSLLQHWHEGDDFLFPLVQLASIEGGLGSGQLHEIISRLRTQVQEALNVSVHHAIGVKKLEALLSAEEAAQIRADLEAQMKELEEAANNPAVFTESELQRLVGAAEAKSALAWIEFLHELHAVGHQNTALGEELRQHPQMSLPDITALIFRSLALQPPLHHPRRAELRHRVWQNMDRDRTCLLNIVNRVTQEVGVFPDESKTKLLVNGHNVQLGACMDKILHHLQTSTLIRAIYFTVSGTLWLDCDMKEKDFHGKNVVMAAASVIVDPPEGPASILKVDVSGNPGKQHPHPKAASGDTEGAHGIHGDHGLPGESSGHVWIMAKQDIVDLHKLDILCNGGEGGPGQHGGDGAAGKPGENGADGNAGVNHPSVIPFWKWTVHGRFERGVKGGPGLNGGNAGKPGRGGTPGAGGSIRLISPTLAAKYSGSGWDSSSADAQAKGSGSSPLHDYSVEWGGAGSGGLRGNPGAKGIGGWHGIDDAWSTRSFWKSDPWNRHTGRLVYPATIIHNWFDKGTEVTTTLTNGEVLRMRERSCENNNENIRNTQHGLDGVKAEGFREGTPAESTPTVAVELPDQVEAVPSLVADLALLRLRQNQTQIARHTQEEEAALTADKEFDEALQQFETKRKHFIEWQQDSEAVRNIQAEVHTTNDYRGYRSLHGSLGANSTNAMATVGSIEPRFELQPPKKLTRIQDSPAIKFLDSITNPELRGSMEECFMSLFSSDSHPNSQHGTIVAALTPILRSTNSDGATSLEKKLALISALPSDFELASHLSSKEFKAFVTPIVSIFKHSDAPKQPQPRDILTTLFTLRSSPEAALQGLIPQIWGKTAKYGGNARMKERLAQILKERLLEFALNDCLRGTEKGISRSKKVGAWLWAAGGKVVQKFSSAPAGVEVGTEAVGDDADNLLQGEEEEEEEEFELIAAGGEDDAMTTTRSMYETFLEKFFSICHDVERRGGDPVPLSFPKVVTALKSAPLEVMGDPEFGDGILQQICNVDTYSPETVAGDIHAVIFHNNSWSYSRILDYVRAFLIGSGTPNHTETIWAPILEALSAHKFQKPRHNELKHFCLEQVRLPEELWCDVIQPYLIQVLEAPPMELTQLTLQLKIEEYEFLQHAIRSSIDSLGDLPELLNQRRLELTRVFVVPELEDVANLSELANLFAGDSASVPLGKILTHLEILPPAHSGTELKELAQMEQQISSFGTQRDSKTCRNVIYNRIRRRFQVKYSAEVTRKFNPPRMAEIFGQLREGAMQLISQLLEDNQVQDDQSAAELWMKQWTHMVNYLEVVWMRAAGSSLLEMENFGRSGGRPLSELFTMIKEMGEIKSIWEMMQEINDVDDRQDPQGNKSMAEEMEALGMNLDHLQNYMSEQSNFSMFLKLCAAYLQAVKRQETAWLPSGGCGLLSFLVQIAPRYLQPAWQWQQQHFSEPPPNFVSEFRTKVDPYFTIRRNPAQQELKDLLRALVNGKDQVVALHVDRQLQELVREGEGTGRALEEARNLVLDTLSTIKSGHNQSKQIQKAASLLMELDNVLFNSVTHISPRNIAGVVQGAVRQFWDSHFNIKGHKSLAQQIRTVIQQKDGHSKFKEAWFQSTLILNNQHDSSSSGCLIGNDQLFNELEFGSSIKDLKLFDSLISRCLHYHFVNNQLISDYKDKIGMDLFLKGMEVVALEPRQRAQLYHTILEALHSSTAEQQPLWSLWAELYNSLDIDSWVTRSFLNPALASDYWTRHFLIRIKDRGLDEDEIGEFLPREAQIQEMAALLRNDVVSGGRQASASVAEMLKQCLADQEAEYWKKLMNRQESKSKKKQQVLNLEKQLAAMLLNNSANYWLTDVLQSVYSDSLLCSLQRNCPDWTPPLPETEEEVDPLQKAVNRLEAIAKEQDTFRGWLAVFEQIVKLTEQYPIGREELTACLHYAGDLTIPQFQVVISSKFPSNWLQAVLWERLNTSLVQTCELHNDQQKFCKKISMIDDNLLKNEYLALAGHRFINLSADISKELLDQVLDSFVTCDTLDAQLLKLLQAEQYLQLWPGVIANIKFARLGIPTDLCTRLRDQEFTEPEMVLEFAQLFARSQQPAGFDHGTLKNILDKFDRMEWHLDAEVLGNLRQEPQANLRHAVRWFRIFELHKAAVLSRKNEGEVLIRALQQDKHSIWKERPKALEKFADILRRLPSQSQVEAAPWTSDGIKAWAKGFRDKGKGHGVQHVLKHKREILSVLKHAVWIWSGLPKEGSKDNEQLPVQFLPWDTQCVAVLGFLDSLRNKGRQRSGRNQLHGRLGQIATGEGKTLTTALLAIALALISSKPAINIMTSSSNLATSNYKDMKALYEMFGISVHNVCDPAYKQATSTDDDRAARFTCQVLYGDVASFQTADLRTKFFGKNITNGRVPSYVIIDEADSTLLDKAGHKLYISHIIPELKYLRNIYIAIWGQVLHQDLDSLLQNMDKFNQRVREVATSVREKINKVAEFIVPNSLLTFTHGRLVTWVENAFEARVLDQDVSFIQSADGTDDGLPKITVVDNDTGEEEPAMQFSFGLAQMLQLGAKFRITSESLKAVYTSNLCYFKNFAEIDGGTIFGISGTLGTQSDRQFLRQTYGLDSFQVPRFRNSKCVHEPGSVHTTEDEWLDAIEDSVACRVLNRALLIICENRKIHAKIMERLKISTRPGVDPDRIREFKSAFDSKMVDYIGTHDLVAGDVLVSTNLAGRGTDLKISGELEAMGGLHVILSYMPPNERVEKQAFGRAARKGDRGSTEQIVLLPAWAYGYGATIKELRALRDRLELNRMSVIINTTNKQIEYEEGLFKKFTQFKRTFMKSKLVSVHSKKVQEIIEHCLQNRWAFWLDSIHESIEKIPDPAAEDRLDAEFIKFQSRIETQLANPPVASIHLLARSFPELLQLARQYELEGRLDDGLQLLDHIIATEPNFSEAAWYYKGVMLVKQERELDKEDKPQARREVRRVFKVAREKIEARIGQYIRTRTLLITNCMISTRDPNINKLQMLEQVQNEIGIIQKHLLELDAVLGQEITPAYLKQSAPEIVDEEEAQELLQNVILKMQGLVKPFRVGRQLKRRMVEVGASWSQNLLDFKYEIMGRLQAAALEPGRRITPSNFTDVLPTSAQFRDQLLRHRLMRQTSEGVDYMVRFNVDKFKASSAGLGLDLPTVNRIGNKLSLANHQEYQRAVILDGVPASDGDILEKQLTIDGILRPVHSYEVSEHLTFVGGAFELPFLTPEAAQLLPLYQNLLEAIFLQPGKDVVRPQINFVDIPLPHVQSGLEIFNFLVEIGVIKKPKLNWPTAHVYSSQHNLSKEVKSAVDKSRSLEVHFQKHYTATEGQTYADRFKKYKDQVAEALITSAGTAKTLPEIDVKYVSLITKYYLGNGRNCRKELIDIKNENFEALPKFTLHVPWWKSTEFIVGCLGLLQIAAGVSCLALCPTLAIGLISEGCGDILYSIESKVCGREMSWGSYGVNKLFSVCMSGATMGIAAWTGGAATATLKRVAMEALEEVAKMAVRKGVEWGVDRAISWARDYIIVQFRKRTKGTLTLHTSLGGILQGFDSNCTEQLARLRENIATLNRTSFEVDQTEKVLQNSITHLFLGKSATFATAIRQFAIAMAGRFSTAIGRAFRKFGLANLSQAVHLIQLVNFQSTIVRAVEEFRTFCGSCLGRLNTYMEGQIRVLEQRRALRIVINNQAEEGRVTRQTSDYVKDVNEYLVNGFLDKLQYEMLQPGLTTVVQSGIEYTTRKAFQKTYQEVAGQAHVQIEAMARERDREIAGMEQHNTHGAVDEVGHEIGSQRRNGHQGPPQAWAELRKHFGNELKVVRNKVNAEMVIVQVADGKDNAAIRVEADRLGIPVQRERNLLIFD